MRFGRSSLLGGFAVLTAGLLLTTACGRRPPAEVSDITPSFSISRSRAPLGSAVEISYSWKTGADFKKLDKEYRGLVHFLDSHRVVLFEDDHVPVPPPSEWQPGQTYAYTRTKFIPIYPYVGDVEVRMGMTPPSGWGERLGLQGEDAGLREYSVGSIELLPQTENIFLVHKSGWHSPEAFPDNPSLERTWTEKDGVVSFKNPKKDVVLYLEADTNSKAFKEPAVLTVSIGDSGLEIPIENSEVFLKKIKFAAETLGDGDWVDLKLAMSESFVPAEVGLNQDERELALLVYHLYVGEVGELGDVVGEVVDSGPLS